MTTRGLYRAAMLTAALAGLALTSLLSTSESALAQDNVGMALEVSGQGVECSGNTCEVPVGTQFTLQIVTAPPPPQGWIGVQTYLYNQGQLPYNFRTAEEENVWDGNVLELRSPQEPNGQDLLIAHGGVTSLTPPFTVTDYEGPLVDLRFTCAGNSTSSMALLTYAVENPLGSTYSVEQDAQTATPPSIGTIHIDANGDTTTEDVGYTDLVNIRCGTGDGGPGPIDPGPDGPNGPDGQDGTPAPGDPTAAPSGPEATQTAIAAAADDTPSPDEATATAESIATATALAEAGEGDGDGDDDDNGGFPVWAWVVIGLAVVGVLGAGGYLGWRYWQSRQGGPPSGPSDAGPSDAGPAASGPPSAGGGPARGTAPGPGTGPGGGATSP
jgi:hypothetical protein